MDYVIDREDRIVLVKIGPSDSGEATTESLLALGEAEPDLWTWDCIIHVPVVAQDASVEQVSRAARQYATQKGVRATTVFVSDDAYLHLWAKVMDFQFPPRKHLVVRDLATARELIFSRRPGKMNRK